MNGLDTIEVDFGEYDLFLQTQSVITPTIKGPGWYTPKITDTRESHHEKAFHELEHPVTPECHFGTQGLVLPQFEIGNGFFRSSNCRFLTTDKGQLIRSHIQKLDVIFRGSLTNANVDDDLLNLR